MLNQDPVKIPNIPGKISYIKKEGMEYVRYLEERVYDPEKKHNIPKWVNIGRRVEGMPGLMYPNDRYEEIFGGRKPEDKMTPEEEQYVRDHGIYGIYSSFFTGLYNEFRQQTRKRAETPVNRYKAESINKVLGPLREMMKGEAYAGMLGMIETGEDGEEGMNYGDVMILLTQYKTAMGKFRSVINL